MNKKLSKQNDSAQIERIIEQANTFEDATGIQCVVIDRNGQKMQGSNCACMFCENMSSNPCMKQKCMRNHIYGMQQAERFGGKYMFFCHIGLVHFVSPVHIDHSYDLALLAGPIMLDNGEVLSPDDIIGNKPGSFEWIRRHAFLFERIPKIETKKAEALSEMLFTLASYVSDPDRNRVDMAKEYAVTQSDIHDAIASLKKQQNLERLPEYPFDKEKELVSWISIGNVRQAKKVLNEIFGHIFFSSGQNFDIIKARVLELLVILSRAAVEGGGNIREIFGLNHVFLNELHQKDSVEALTEWLTQIMSRFTDCVFDLAEAKHVDVLYRSLGYIHSNYMKKITLEEVASHSYLSPTYFSRIFKEEMNITFNTYVNRVRIEMSKKLLTDERVSLIQVSELTGFENQSYFSKVFKRMVGISPGKYRETMGRGYKTPNAR